MATTVASPATALAAAVLVQVFIAMLAIPVDCSNRMLAVQPQPDVSTLLTQCTNEQSRSSTPNSFICYRTTTTQNGRFPSCGTSLVKEDEISIISKNENYTIMMVHSPGRLHNRSYVNRLLCQWDIRCPVNQLMYFDLAEHKIEPKRKSSLFGDVCVDYLKIYRESGMEMSCGNGATNDNTYLEPNNLRVEFRSNTKISYPGFKLRVACFNPDLQDADGCALSNYPSATKKRRSERRFVRTASMDWAGQSSKHSLSHHPHRLRRSTQVQQIMVNQASTILYGSSTVQIKGQGGAVTFSVKDIRSFHTYTSLEGQVSYYSGRGQEVALRGGGLLTVQQNVGAAYYYLYGVDPKFEPTQEERELINRLLEAEEALVVNNDFVIQEEESSTDATTTPYLLPKRDTTENKGDMFDRDMIDSATAGANSCNAVLRVVAKSMLDLIQ